MQTIPQYKLRRLAPRAIRVWERHKELEPALQGHETRVVVSAKRMIAAYDAVRTLRNARAGTVQSHGDATTTLLTKMRAWTALLVKDIAGFSRGEFGDNSRVADDVISDAEHLVELVRKEVEGGAQMAYAEGLLADLDAALAAAIAENASSGTSRSDFTAARKELREASVDFQTDLRAFRITLRAFLGKGHPDYQKLRMYASVTTDDDDDEVGAEILEEFSDQIADEKDKTPEVDEEDAEGEEEEAA